MTSHDAQPAKKRSVPRWLGTLVGIVVVIAGGAKLIGAMTLPGCDASETAQIVREIFKEKTGETVQVSDAKLVSEADAEKAARRISRAQPKQPISPTGSFGTAGRRWCRSARLRHSRSRTLRRADSAPVALRRFFVKYCWRQRDPPSVSGRTCSPASRRLCPSSARAVCRRAADDQAATIPKRC